MPVTSTQVFVVAGNDRLLEFLTPEQIVQVAEMMSRMRILAIERGIGQSVRLVFNERGLLRGIEGSDNVRVEVPKT